MPEAALPILLYHKLGRPPRGCRLTGHYVHSGLFRKQLALLARRGYRTMSLSALDAALSDKHPASAPPSHRPLLLTFDDGYCSFHDLAAPVLSELGFGAVVFLVTDYLGRPSSWEADQARVPVEPLLSERQVVELAQQDFEFGSHGLTHAHLTQLSDRELRREVTDSKSRIEDLLGRRCLAFAYPYGECDPRVTAAVAEAGYRLAFTTRRGWARAGDHLLLLPRINIRRHNYLPLFTRKLRRAQAAIPPRERLP